MGAVNNVRFDGQIVVNKIRRIAVVGQNTADFRCGKNYDVRSILLQPMFDCGLIPQVDD